jgi:hypothetical protein
MSGSVPIPETERVVAEELWTACGKNPGMFRMSNSRLGTLCLHCVMCPDCRGEIKRRLTTHDERRVAQDRSTRLLDCQARGERVGAGPRRLRRASGSPSPAERATRRTSARCRCLAPQLEYILLNVLSARGHTAHHVHDEPAFDGRYRERDRLIACHHRAILPPVYYSESE